MRLRADEANGGRLAPALAWSNGTDGCNSFGTHDWILKKAINAAGSDAAWVRVRVALRATDDPDCKDGIDHASGTWWHVYDRWGDEWGGADTRRLRERLTALCAALDLHGSMDTPG